MKKYKIVHILIMMLLCIAILSSCLLSGMKSTNTFNISGSKELVVNFIDVGQGDSIFIHLPNLKNMLIDAGPGIAENNVVQYIKSSGIVKLDYVVASHPHEDHIGGMYRVVDLFETQNIYMPNVTTNTATYGNLLKLINSRGLHITTATKGQVIFDTVVNGKKLSAVILSPKDSYYEDLNNYSAVVKLTYGTTSFLFEGDAGIIPEAQMISSGVNITANVLKIGHHGSFSASSKGFLDKVAPSVAVISCGKDNLYGHPHQETIDNLQARGISIYRTDINGTIVMKSDGLNVKEIMEK